MGEVMRLLTVAWLLISLQLDWAIAGSMPAENGFKFSEKGIQDHFVARLVSEGISYRTREDGTVLYSPKDENIVVRIRMAVLNESFVPSAYFPDLELEQRFIDRLNAQSIRFTIRERTGKRWIVWSERDDERVKKICDSILDSQ
jgi:hypothetical protein